MARSEAERPVLRFPLPGVRSHQGLRWILWPALAWRVIAPRPRARKLNVLQRAVLGLCAVGLARAEDIGEKLMIGRDLAAHILEELRGAGWVDSLHRPTTQGRSALQEDMGEPIEDMTVGWVFTDPFSGQVWPRFHSGELPMAAVERDRGPKPMLLSGTIGDPRRDIAFQVHVRSHDQTQGARPQAEEVLRAARAHRKQHDWEEQALVPDPPAVQRVSFVLEEPTDCLLATRVWLAAPGDWKIDDPFGIGQSLRLRRWIEERLDTDRGLRDWLEPILGGDPTSTSFASLGQQAEWLVEERLTTAIRARRDLRDRLVAMQRTLLETDLDGCPEDRWDDVAVKAQRAAERAFLEIKDAHPPHVPVGSDEELNEALFDGLARTLGFDVPLPPSLTRVRRGKVIHAAEQGTGSLRALVLLALLGAAGVPDHPLARAAGQEPRLLHKLDDLARTRDSVAHEGPGGRAALLGRRDRIREGVETVFSTVKLLFSK